MTIYPVSFLSTLPARGATGTHNTPAPTPDISIHAPREGSDYPFIRKNRAKMYFYPRSPRGERPTTQTMTVSGLYFYPRSPRGERRVTGYTDLKLKRISIHAPREGSDGQPAASHRDRGYFYPRSPRGERRDLLQERGYHQIFLSTLPARGATGTLYLVTSDSLFLSTLPARGATSGAPRWSAG